MKVNLINAILLKLYLSFIIIPIILDAADKMFSAWYMPFTIRVKSNTRCTVDRQMNKIRFYIAQHQITMQVYCLC